MLLSTRPPKQILVLRSGAVGDFVVTTPVLKSLRDAYPNAHISILGRPDRTVLADHLVDRHLDMDDARWARLFSASPNLDRDTCALIEETDLILNYLPDTDGQLTQNLSTLCPGRVVTHHPRPVSRTHIIDHLLSALDDLAIPYSKAPSITHDSTPEADTILIHPGSGGTEKMWPADRFAEVANTLRESNPVTFTCGPADSAIIRDLNRLCPDCEFLNPMSLPQLTSHLASATLYIGNDTGPSHMAAAVGTPSIVLFGPTDPEVWGPTGTNVEILTGSSDLEPGQRLLSILPEAVVNTANQLISKQIQNRSHPG